MRHTVYRSGDRILDRAIWKLPDFNETSKTTDSQCVYSDRHGARENDIVASLGLNNPVTMVTGFDRPNLFSGLLQEREAARRTTV